MNPLLATVIDNVRVELAQREECIDYATIKRMACEAPPARDAVPVLLQSGVAVIAEIIRACPARGRLADIPDPGLQARKYVDAGACCVSVQTERHYYRGSLVDLSAVRKSVDVPVLMKDFVVTPYQIHEARAHGADLVQLIAEALDEATLESLLDRIESLGMTGVVEVHSPEEASRAVNAGARVVALNARNLETNTIDRSIIGEIAAGLPSAVVRIGEAGVRGPHDLLAYAGAGVDAVLVGEGIVTADHPEAAVSDLVIAGTHPSCPARS